MLWNGSTENIKEQLSNSFAFPINGVFSWQPRVLVDIFCSLCTGLIGRTKENPWMISFCSKFLTVVSFTITDVWLPLERKNRSWFYPLFLCQRGDKLHPLIVSLYVKFQSALRIVPHDGRVWIQTKNLWRVIFCADRESERLKLNSLMMQKLCSATDSLRLNLNLGVTVGKVPW